MPYPVIEARRLRAAPRRWMGLSVRRDPADLPELPPHGAYVFAGAGEDVQFDDRHPLDLTHPAVVDSGTVSVVDLRRRSLTVDALLPTRTPPERFTLLVTFHAQVSNAKTVATAGYGDVAGALRQYLLADRDLMAIAQEFSGADVLKAAIVVRDQVLARGDIIPPKVPGMELDVLTVELLPPGRVSSHLTDKLDLERDAEMRLLAREVHLSEVRDLLPLVQNYGLDGAELLAIARKESTAAELVRQMRATNIAGGQAKLEVLQALLEQGHGKGTDLSAVIEQLLLPPGQDVTQRSVEGRSSRTPLERPPVIAEEGDDD